METQEQALSTQTESTELSSRQAVEMKRHAWRKARRVYGIIMILASVPILFFTLWGILFPDSAGTIKTLQACLLWFGVSFTGAKSFDWLFQRFQNQLDALPPSPKQLAERMDGLQLLVEQKNHELVEARKEILDLRTKLGLPPYR